MNRHETHWNGPYRLELTDRAGCPAEVVSRIVDCWHSYPEMSSRFNPDAPLSLTLIIDPNYEGVGETQGTVITLSGSHFQQHPWDSDVMTHEQFHVVQNYGEKDYPFWAMEGLADYARSAYGRYNEQGGWALPDFSPAHRHTDAYRVTARFFLWLENHRSPSFLVDLDRRMRQGSYEESFWDQKFGRSIERLWLEYASNPGL